MAHEHDPQVPTTIDEEALLTRVKAMAAEVDVINAREARLAGKAPRVKADSILAIPQPEALDLVQIPDLADRIIAKAAEVEHVAVLVETLAQTAAISAYLRGRDRDARRQLARADRTLEIRIGELLGQPRQGQRSDLDPTSPHTEKLHAGRAGEFRLMAAHQNEPVVAEAISTGESRARILGLIKDLRRESEPADNTGSPVGIEIVTGCGTADHGPFLETDVVLSTVFEDLPAPDTVETLALDPSPCLEADLDVAHLTLPTTDHIIDVPVRHEAALSGRDPLQVITDAVGTLTMVADELDLVEVGHVHRGDLASVAEALRTPLVRINAKDRLIRDWLRDE